jgi:hypothetical protein
MPRFGDMAYFDGRDLPRCTKRPTAAERNADRTLRRGTWECMLPAGHERFDNPRHHPHSWGLLEEEED